ncbi:hypothetical protein C3E77_09635 [Mycetocola zhujimingii]|nr:hypothetical protein C3E77_09635 [Mycetocola zhujimingii]
MPTLLRAVVAGLAIAGGAVSLFACAQPSAQPTPTPTAIFASEDEALAAATDTYAKYSAAYDLSNSLGGKDMSSVAPYVTDAHLMDLGVPGVLQENGWHTTGISTFTPASIDRFKQEGERAEVILNLCRDVSQVRIVAADGSDVTPVERSSVLPLSVTLTSANEDPRKLLVSKVESWTEDVAC